MVDGKAEVSGQVAVMGINAILLQELMQKNPGVSFAIQESFPLEGTYADALPMGPLMQLQARTDDNPFTSDLAAQALGYWQNKTQQLLSDSDSPTSDEALKAYSHDTTAAARLLAAHDFANEAESAYRLGMQLYPANPEPVTGLASLLATAGRQDEANQLLDDFAQKHPDEQSQLGKLTASAKLLWKPKAGGK